MNLRTKLIRLAHQKPELRGTLLPLLKQDKQASQDKQAFGLDRQWFTSSLTRYPGSEHFPNYDGLDVEGFFIVRGVGKPEGAAFYGKQNTPAFHYSFRDRADFLVTLDKLAAGRRRDLAEKAKARALRKEYLHDYVVGDILYSSFGYDQTNVYFYEITATKGKMVVLRQIGKKTTREESSYGAEYVVATPGRFVGPPLKKMVGQGGYVRIDSSELAHKWDGKPKYQTSSGWGH